ncbi:MAG: hypothetical protein ACXW2U_19415 [Telluria sp.]
MLLMLGIFSACSDRSSAASRPRAEDTPQPYVLENTEVRDIRARTLNRDYQVFVSLPRDYAQSTRTYPVLFVTDATYAFPLIRSIAKRVRNGGEDLEDFILKWALPPEKAGER